MPPLQHLQWDKPSPMIHCSSDVDIIAVVIVRDMSIAPFISCEPACKSNTCLASRQDRYPVFW